MYRYMHNFVYVCMYIYMYIYVYMHIYVYICTYINTAYCTWSVNFFNLNSDTLILLSRTILPRFIEKGTHDIEIED